MKEETDLREVVVDFLKAENLFAGAVVPILGEAEIGERTRPCVTVEVAANGRLTPLLPIKMLKIEVLTQRDDTPEALASGWGQEVMDAIQEKRMEIAELMYQRGWMIKGFSIDDATEEKEGKRAFTGGLNWRVVLCRV